MEEFVIKVFNFITDQNFQGGLDSCLCFVSCIVEEEEEEEARLFNCSSSSSPSLSSSSSGSSSIFQKCSELGAAGCVPLSVLT
jgi:hypothetical protein